MEENQKKSKLVIAQWIFAAIGAMMAVSALSKGFLGVFGGIFLLVSAFVVSPLAEKLPFYEKINVAKTAKVALQFLVAFILCSIGAVITPSNNSDTEDTSLDTSIVETQNIETNAETETEAKAETESEIIADAEPETDVVAEAEIESTTVADEESETDTVVEAETENTSVTNEELEADVETEVETENATVADEDHEIETDAEAETVPAHRDGMVGISDKSLTDDGIEVQYSTSVPNDVTGNWRLAKIHDDIDFTAYAVSYYNEYVKNSKEVHMIINYARNETIVFNVFGSISYITIHKYIDGEEKDAKVLGGGDVISEYTLYLDNGDIEKLR